MTELKIRTHGNENLSKAIQNELFKLGYKARSTTHNHDLGKYLYANHDGQLGWSGGGSTYYDDFPGKEVTIYDLIEMNAQNDTKQSKLRAIREEMEEHNKVGEVLAARLKEEEEK